MSVVFHFATAAELVEITGLQARNLHQLLGLVQTATPGAIFHHAYQTLQEHRFAAERYPNDFADWVHTSCGEAALAERLAAVDLRDHRTLRSLRSALVRVLEDYLDENSASRTRPARSAFDLCSAISVVTPTGDRAVTLDEFRGVIKRCSAASVHHHFVTARLRLDLASNDFSAWLRASLRRHDLAQRLDRIDFVMQTLDEIRWRIIEALE